MVHDIFGRMVEDRKRVTDNHLGYNIIRWSIQQCEACAMGKAKHKNIMKASKNVPATKSNKRVFLDISEIKNQKNGKKVTLTKNNWRVILENFSVTEFSDFYDTNNGIIGTTCEWFGEWKQNVHLVSFGRCNNVGENTKIEKTANSKV